MAVELALVKLFLTRNYLVSLYPRAGRSGEGREHPAGRHGEVPGAVPAVQGFVCGVLRQE